MGYGKEQMTKHSITRAKERYDIVLTEEDVNNMVLKIRSGKSIRGEGGTKTRTRSIHKILYKGLWFRVIYSKSVKTLVTCLPPDEADYNTRELKPLRQTLLNTNDKNNKTTVECPYCGDPVVLKQPENHSEYVPTGICPSCGKHIYMYGYINKCGEFKTRTGVLTTLCEGDW